MHSKLLLPGILLLSTAYAATLADVVASNTALTQQADTVDSALVDITAQTDPTTAQQLPTSLQNLVNAISADLNPPTSTANPPPTVFDLVESFGLFANTIEELAYDYYEQRNNLIGVFGLQSAIYNQLIPLNTSFHEYFTLASGLAGDPADQRTMTFDASNATFGINNATSYYAP